MSKINNCNNIPIFRYDAKDYNFVINKKNDFKSAFDLLIVRKWEEVEENAVLNYSSETGREKMLKGNYGFLAKLHLERGVKKRKAQNIVSMSHPCDPYLFNFTKIRDQEILFNIENGDGNDIVAASTNPLRKYHCLLIIKRFGYHPQKVTRYSIEKAIDMLLISYSPYLRLIFNSLCGQASVNHLHWHLYDLKQEMLLEYINVEHLAGPIFALIDFPAKGFCLKLSSFKDRNIDALISWTYFLIDYMQTNNIPHNVAMSRAKDNSNSNIYNDIRIYIWARKSHSAYEYKNYNFNQTGFTFFGALTYYNSEEGYEDLTEDEVTEILNDVTSESFSTMKNVILKMNFDEKEFENKINQIK